MADETKTVIIDVEVAGKADKQIGDLNAEIKKNRENIKELSKDYDKNSEEIAANERENRNLTATKRELIKQSKAEEGSLNSLRLKLSEQVKLRNNLNRSTVEGAKSFDEMNKAIFALNEEISGFEEAGGDFRRNVGNYPELLGAAGGSIKIFGTSLTDVFNIIKGNPIILFISALAGLVKVFAETQTGAEFFRKTSAILSTTLGFLKDIVEDLGGQLISAFENPQQALKDFGQLIKDNISNRFEGLIELVPKLGKAISLLFKGEFSAAGKVALDAVAKVTLGVEDFTDKVVDAAVATVQFFNDVAAGAEKAGLLEKQLIANEKALADLEVRQAQSIKNQKELNLVVEDTTKTFEERIAAAEAFAQVESDQINESVRLQEERLRILKEQNDITNSTEEDLQRVRDAEIVLANLQAASFEREVTNNNKLNGLRAASTAQRLADQKLITDQISKGIADTLKINQAASKKAIALAKAETAAKKSFQNDLLANTIAVFGESSTVGKIAASIQAGINVTEGVTKALAAAPPPFNFALAAITAAAGAIQIGKINSVSTGASAISSGGGGGGSAPSAPSAGSLGNSLSSVNASLLGQFSTAPTAANDAAQNTGAAVSQNLPVIQVAVTDINDVSDSLNVKVAEASLG